MVPGEGLPVARAAAPPGGTAPAGRREDADVVTASDGYAGRFAGSAGAWFLRVQAATVRDFLADLPPDSLLLEVGGGHGQLAPAVREAGHRLVVLGSAPEAVGRLAPLLRDPGVRFEVGDLLDPPYRDRAFEAVLCFRLLTHAEEWKRLVSGLCRVARRCVIVDYPSSRSVNVLSDRLFGMKKGIEGNTRRFALFRPAEIERAFADSGYRVTAARGQFVLPMVLHRMHGSAGLGRALEAPARALGLSRWIGSPVIVRADRSDG